LSPLPNTKRSISLSAKEATNNGNIFNKNAAANDPELIVSGGGGAFLHGTHVSLFILQGRKTDSAHTLYLTIF
jgi:hypothetical protein